MSVRTDMVREVSSSALYSISRRLWSVIFCEPTYQWTERMADDWPLMTQCNCARTFSRMVITLEEEPEPEPEEEDDDDTRRPSYSRYGSSGVSGVNTKFKGFRVLEAKIVI